jgi:hypothetical protein
MPSAPIPSHHLLSLKIGAPRSITHQIIPIFNFLFQTINSALPLKPRLPNQATINESSNLPN